MPVSTDFSFATFCGGPPPRAAPPPPAGLPPGFPPGFPGDLPGFFLVSLIALASALDHVAGRLGDAHLATAVKHAEPDLGRIFAFRIDQHQVRQVNRRLFLDDAAGLRHALRLDVLGGDSHALDQGALDAREDPQHLAAAALFGPRDHHHRVALTDARGHHNTSGASEMIFMNFLARSSRTTGPKMRVPIGSSCLVISTAALRSKRIAEPSGRRTGYAVRTITAWCTSPFFTLPRGIASRIDTTMTSPTEAVLRFDPPSTLMHCTRRAPELSATSRLVSTEIMPPLPLLCSQRLHRCAQ